MDDRKDKKAIAAYVSQFEMNRFLNERLIQCLRLRRYAAFETVMIEEGHVDALSFLVEGRLQCTHYHVNGKAAVIALTEPFAAIGDMEVLSTRPNRTNVIATQPSTMLAISNGDVERHGANDPRFLRFLLDQVRTKLVESNAVRVSQVLRVSSRLGLFILSRVADDDTTVLPKKEALASLLGTTQRHLNRVINELVESGAIETAYPTVRLTNREELEAIVER